MTVVTSDVRFAGTDADVFIKLHGSAGSSGALQLENAADNFERGRTDVFHVAAADVGAVESIEVWHGNNCFASSDWHLQHIQVPPLSPCKGVLRERMVCNGSH